MLFLNNYDILHTDQYLLGYNMNLKTNITPAYSANENVPSDIIYNISKHFTLVWFIQCRQHNKHSFPVGIGCTITQS